MINFKMAMKTEKEIFWFHISTRQSKVNVFLIELMSIKSLIESSK